MKVMADICVIPIGVGVSLSPYIKKAYAILRGFPLEVTLCPYGTVVEGEYQVISAAIEKIMLDLHADGVPRVTMTIKLGSRIDKEQTAQDKINAVLGEQ